MAHTDSTFLSDPWLQYEAGKRIARELARSPREYDAMLAAVLEEVGL